MAGTARTASPAARLRSLKSALDRARSLPRKTVLSSTPMRELIGVSWPVLRGWCDSIEGFEESGAFTRGANGIEYQFRPVQTIRFLIKHFEAESNAAAKKNRRIRKAVGINLPEEEDTASFAEVKGMVEMTISAVNAKERQGYYTPTQEVADFIEGYNARVIAGILGVRTRVDPNGNLPAHVRARMDDELRAVAAHAHASAEAYVKEKRARLQPAGTR